MALIHWNTFKFVDEVSSRTNEKFDKCITTSQYKKVRQNISNRDQNKLIQVLENGVISLLWYLRSWCNVPHLNFRLSRARHWSLIFCWIDNGTALVARYGYSKIRSSHLKTSHHSVRINFYPLPVFFKFEVKFCFLGPLIWSAVLRLMMSKC